MKEVVVRLADNIAGQLARDARDKGISSEELIKYILGSYANESRRETEQSMPSLIGVLMSSSLRNLGDPSSKLSAEIGKELLKHQARAGALSCKRCTMKLTEQDVDNDKCGACDVPLKIALGAEEQE